MRYLSEIKSAKPVFYNVVVAAAYRIDVTPGAVSVVFQPNQKVARQQCDEQKAWLQGLAEKVMGRPVVVSVSVNEGAAPAAPSPAPAQTARPNPEDVTRDAMSNATVQAVLEIFPVEKTTVEEICKVPRVPRVGARCQVPGAKVPGLVLHSLSRRSSIVNTASVGGRIANSNARTVPSADSREPIAES